MIYQFLRICWELWNDGVKEGCIKREDIDHYLPSTSITRHLCLTLNEERHWSGLRFHYRGEHGHWRSSRWSCMWSFFEIVCKQGICRSCKRLHRWRFESIAHRRGPRREHWCCSFLLNFDRENFRRGSTSGRLRSWKRNLHIVPSFTRAIANETKVPARKGKMNDK